MNPKYRALARLQIVAGKSYLHFSDNEFEVGKTYTHGKGKGTFGDWEKVFEKYRPTGTISRLASFYLVESRKQYNAIGLEPAEFMYEVQPVSKIAECKFIWLAHLMIKNSKYRKRSGSVFDVKVDLKAALKDSKRVDDMKRWIRNYYENAKPDAELKDTLTVEKPFTEILVAKVKIIKKFNARTGKEIK